MELREKFSMIHSLIKQKKKKKKWEEEKIVFSSHFRFNKFSSVFLFAQLNDFYAERGGV
jgi:hypothetical protein